MTFVSVIWWEHIVRITGASIPWDKGQGEVSKNRFFRPLGPQFGLKIRGVGPLPWICQSAFRAVKKFLNSRLIMNSRRLWNSHQRHKFLRAEASSDILKNRVSEIVFPEVFKRYYAPRTSGCLDTRLGTMPSKFPMRSKTSPSLNVLQI